MDKQKIRDKSSQDNTRVLLVEKGKRGALNVIFGRTMVILVLIALQILLLFLAFNSSISNLSYLYYALIVFYAALILHLVNKPANPSIKITWILLVVLAPPLGVFLYLFVEMDWGHRVLNRRLSALMDETKFGSRALFTFATGNDVDYLITNEKPMKDYADALGRFKGMHLIVSG